MISATSGSQVAVCAGLVGFVVNLESAGPEEYSLTITTNFIMPSFIIFEPGRHPHSLRPPLLHHKIPILALARTRQLFPI